MQYTIKSSGADFWRSKVGRENLEEKLSLGSVLGSSKYSKVVSVVKKFS